MEARSLHAHIVRTHERLSVCLSVCISVCLSTCLSAKISHPRPEMIPNEVYDDDGDAIMSAATTDMCTSCSK